MGRNEEKLIVILDGFEEAPGQLLQKELMAMPLIESVHVFDENLDFKVIQNADCYIYSSESLESKKFFEHHYKILVDFTKKYETAVLAVKNKISNILSWPVDLKDLKAVFGEAQREKKVNKASSFKDIFSFISNTELEITEDRLFTSINHFLGQSLQTLPFLVFSVPYQSTDGNSKKKLRFHWNKKQFDDSYNMKDHFDLFDEVRIDKLTSGVQEFLIVKDSARKCSNVFMAIGLKEKQFLVGCFRVNSDKFTEESLMFQLFLKHIKISFRHIEALRIEKKLASLAHTDDVTGMFNQRKLNDDLVEIIAQSEKLNQEFALIFIDLDHFKEINDNHGHRIGSLLLKEVALIFKKALRDTDLVYRYGGDEFIIIIPNSDAVEGLSSIIGERLLKMVRETTFKPEKGLEIKLSASIGVADYPTHAKTKDQIIEIADQMMYCAKKEGRGKVCHAKKLLAS